MAWTPDDVVVDAVLAGRLSYRDLAVEDSRWVVATLTHQGHSTAEVAGWLRCSKRQVQRVKVEMVTRVMGAILVEREEREETAGVCARLRREVRSLREDNARLQVQGEAYLQELYRRSGAGQDVSASGY